MELAFILRDRKLLDTIRHIQSSFSPAGQQAIFQEWARRVSLLVEIPYPAHTFAPLPKIYSWGDGLLHKFPSPEAQRGFFAALHNGRITVPYERTRRLANALQFDLSVQPNRAALAVTVADPHPGFDAKWVLGEREQQSYYFRELTNWEPLEETLRRPPLYDDIEDAGRIAFETIFEDLGT